MSVYANPNTWIIYGSNLIVFFFNLLIYVQILYTTFLFRF